MKAEIRADLRAKLAGLPLGTTAGSRTQASRLLSPGETREALKVHDQAIDVLITEGEHDDRDLAELQGTAIEHNRRLDALELQRLPELFAVEAPAAPVVGPLEKAAMITLGATLAALVLWCATLTSAVVYLVLSVSGAGR